MLPQSLVLWIQQPQHQMQQHQNLRWQPLHQNQVLVSNQQMMITTRQRLSWSHYRHPDQATLVTCVRRGLPPRGILGCTCTFTKRSHLWHAVSVTRTSQHNVGGQRLGQFGWTKFRLRGKSSANSVTSHSIQTSWRSMSAPTTHGDAWQSVPYASRHLLAPKSWRNTTEWNTWARRCTAVMCVQHSSAGKRTWRNISGHTRSRTTTVACVDEVIQHVWWHLQISVWVWPSRDTCTYFF